MVLIQPGTYRMGSGPREPMSRVDEERRRITILQPFWLAATEVTQAAWLAVMGENPSYFLDCPDCPVETVSWYAALEFCNALSRRDNLTPAYLIDGATVVWRPEAEGYRLPTEAEWEFACRAGSITLYSTGACLSDQQANFDAYQPLPGCAEGMHRDETVAVASFPPNAWGLYDMHGNVSEWCWDWYGPYDPGAVRDPVGPPDGAGRVIRGGNWFSPGDRCRSAFRASSDPRQAYDLVGLRPARNAGGSGGRS